MSQMQTIMLEGEISSLKSKISSMERAERDRQQEEYYSQLKKKYAEQNEQLKSQSEESAKLRKENQNLKIQTAQSAREWYQDILYKFICPMLEPTIRVAHEENINLSIEQLKESIAVLIKKSCENAGFEQHETDFIVFLTKKTETIQYIISNNTYPSLGEFINNSAIVTVNNYGINYFHKNITPFFSMFTPQEIVAGYPSTETLPWASENQIKRIIYDLIPWYGEKIILFGENLKHLDEYQVDMLTPEQIQAIKKANIYLPQDSPIFQKINKRSKKITQNKKEVPPMETSKCCLLI